MKVACKRQKLPEDAAKYEKLRDEFDRKHEVFIKLLEKRNNQKRGKYDN
jgi:hypothetical protein